MAHERCRSGPLPTSRRALVTSRQHPIDSDETDRLFAEAYAELKRLASSRLRAAGGYATLSTTELVHEAYLKIAGGQDWESRGHLLGVACHAMRQVLVDFARRRNAAKRGGNPAFVTLDEARSDPHLERELERMLELDRALDQLDTVNERLRRVVELRFFGGVPGHDVARALGVSERTVERDWLKARLFLLETLAAEAGPRPAPTSLTA